MTASVRFLGAALAFARESVGSAEVQDGVEALVPSAPGCRGVAFELHQCVAGRACECVGDGGPRVRVGLVGGEKCVLHVSDPVEFH